ncbi:DUF1566 domain-containing protein [Seleniivibrio woodruffii]|uniref:Uncharacterized protein DUF1566 n=1 Tax=Seleniivibrio woodruffii TaxID=1078050 RepID=A0A4R1KCN4_9BACT|nr:DUF1566 domain-containing protein [Seleniivibrio woodruffii]TCK62305.1 uncharacterized protein DUF1566 [Seleniivibrio woodruffii]TVZ34578.1 uncharacterized protein DUF1566 [Seleniivibrio woodruffii]
MTAAAGKINEYKCLTIFMVFALCFVFITFFPLEAKAAKKDVVVFGTLMWQDNDAAKTVKRDWRGAIRYCEELNYKGFSDWRLPTKDELESIVDKGRKPSIYKSFKNTSRSGYWSSSPYYSVSSSLAWVVGFESGGSETDSKTSEGSVRCVRRRYASDMYVELERLNSESVVIDRENDLVWLDTESVTTMPLNWYDAKKYCDNLGPKWYWRLPSPDELGSIVNAGNRPTVKKEFKYALPEAYWTSYMDIENAQAAAVSFYDGRAFMGDASSGAYVRCIRSLHRTLRDDKNNLVYNTETKLLWQDNSDVRTLKLDNAGAKKYCGNLSLAGLNDWRLPSSDELKTIIDSRFNPAVKHEFVNIIPKEYWTSTSERQGFFFFVDFKNGQDLVTGAGSEMNVICVRDHSE